MKSKTIAIHSTGDGFRDATLETEQMADGLATEESLQLCLITEEMLSLFRSVTGTVNNAEFWLENEDKKFTFHLSTQQKLGNVQRSELIQSTTSGTNDAAKGGFLGKLKEVFVQAMSVGKDIDTYYNSDGYTSQAADITDNVISSPKWDKYERSVLLSLSDNVAVSIKGGKVELTVIKQL